MGRIKESTKKFEQEFKKAAGTAIIAAFGLLTALAWKDAIAEYLSKVTSISPLQGTLITAIIITLISIIVIMIITKIASQPEKN